MIELQFSVTAQKDLSRLPKKHQRQIINKLEYYLSSPNPLRFASPLINYRLGQYRFRIGDYRLIFDLKDFSTIIILRIGHRREIYR